MHTSNNNEIEMHHIYIYSSWQAGAKFTYTRSSRSRTDSKPLTSLHLISLAFPPDPSPFEDDNDWSPTAHRRARCRKHYILVESVHRLVRSLVGLEFWEADKTLVADCPRWSQYGESSCQTLVERKSRRTQSLANLGCICSTSQRPFRASKLAYGCSRKISQGSSTFLDFVTALQTARNALASSGAGFTINDSIHKNHLLFFCHPVLSLRVRSIPSFDYGDMKVDALIGLMGSTWDSIVAENIVRSPNTGA